MKSKARFNPTEKKGILKVEQIFNEFGWITRKILEADFGVDMEVEICHHGEPTGKLLGIQIKSGISYFITDLNDDIIYRGSRTHLDYWLNHSLPIIIVLHNPENNLTVWQKITAEKVTITKKGWKV
jgi:hypothetical protein